MLCCPPGLETRERCRYPRGCGSFPFINGAKVMETPETQIINVGATRNSRQANQLRSSHFQKASPQRGRSVRGLFCKWNQKPAVLNYFKIFPLIFIYLYSKCLGDPPSYTVFKLVIWPALSIIKVVIKAGEEIIWTFPFYFPLSVNKYFLSILFYARHCAGSW